MKGMEETLKKFSVIVNKIFICLKEWQTLAGALFGFFAIAYGNYESDKLSRAQDDRHLQDRCNALRATLSTDINLMDEQLSGMVEALNGKSNPSLGKIFNLPEIDDQIEYKDGLYMLNDNTRDSVLRTIIFYRILRSDLINTNSGYHAGDTFGVTIPQNIEMYRKMATAIRDQGEITIRILKDSQQCSR